jgi:hypothetical protein
MWSVVVAAALALGGHNASQGTSRFTVADDLVAGETRVDIEVELLETDLPELCNVDFGVVDAQKRRAMEERLDVCVSNGLPRWLRLHSDDRACRVSAGRSRRGDGLELWLLAEAFCPALPGHSLVVDWGMFGASSLDHQSTATVQLPDGTEVRALLSKRKNKLRVDVPDAGAVAGVVAAVVVAIVVAIVITGGAVRTLLVVARRRRRSQQPR